MKAISAAEKKLQILLIEDDPEDATIIIEAIESISSKKNDCGSYLWPKFNVTHTKSVSEGISTFQEHYFDAVLSDLHLPDARGERTIKKLTENIENAPIIVLSELFTENIAISALKDGVQDYVGKDKLGDVNLVQKIIHAIARQKLRLELDLKNKELSEAIAENLKLLKFKSKFFTQMSHEIRTPLNGVMGIIDILLNDSSVKPKHASQLKTIKNCGHNMLDLMNDILDLSKIDAGKTSLTLSDVDLERVLSECVQTFSPTAISKNVDLSFSIAPSIHKTISTDYRRLTQILSNLVANAIKFTNKGGVQIIVRSAFDSAKLRFEVKDTGRGIPKEEVKNLFIPFTQAKTEDQHTGTGLGLSISAELVQLFGGELKVTSKETEGSSFYFDIDYKKIQTTAPELVKANIIGNKKSDKRVLIVDDVALNQQIVARMLSLKGYESDSVGSGELAIRSASKKKYDLICMDVSMPGMDGVEASARIRSSCPLNNQTPIVALTGHDLAELKEQSKELSIDGHIQKPVQMDNLQEILDKFIR